MARLAASVALSDVAPLAGSVDRNDHLAKDCLVLLWSLPSRGAWIEIYVMDALGNQQESLPSRGAWIEILNSVSTPPVSCCRSPRGERG